jgi:DNA-binding MarR family transcriptional regulator
MDEASGETIAFLIGDAARLFRQRFEEALAAEGLDITVGEARTLFHAARGAGARQNVLAERMNIEPMTLVNFLDRLESRGWVTREVDPKDRRAKVVRVTEAARPLVERVDKIAADVRARASVGVSSRDMAAARRALQAMRTNLSDGAEEQAA